MAKSGRKRKNVSKREKNGRSQRTGRTAERDRVMTVALEQRRRHGLAGEAARDSRAESPLGRMLLTGRLSSAEHQAGERLRARRAAFLAELDGPRVACSAGSAMVANTLRSEDADRLVENRSDRPETPAERRERVREQWAEAKDAALAALGGSRAGLALLMRVACELVDPQGEAEAVVVRMALRRLAARWGLAEPGGDGPREPGRPSEPGLRPLRVALDGRELWRFPKAKNCGKAVQDA